MPVKIFCCYAHEDETLLNKLKAHLKPLQRAGLVDVWYDRDISAGTDWEQEIKERLNTAQIILLLVSPDFMASDYCYSIEMQRAIARHELGEAQVIPIILRPVYWQDVLGKLQALPTDAIPVMSSGWQYQDEAFFNVTEGIRKVAVKVMSSLTLSLQTLPIESSKPEPTETPANVLQQQTRKPEPLVRPEDFSWLCIHTLTGHENTVLSVAFSPDGQTLASGSSDGTIKLWNVQTGQLLRTLADHTNPVLSVALSADGLTLASSIIDIASGSSDGTIKLWNVQTGQLLRTLQVRVQSIAISPDGQTLASGSSDGTIKLWNVQTGQLLRTLQDHRYSVNSVALSTDGLTLASGSSDHSIKLWNVQTGQLLHTLKGHASYVWSVALSTDGLMVASGSEDKTVKLWNVQTGQLLRTLTDHAGEVYSVALSTDGLMVASGSEDKTVKLWNVQTGQFLHTLTDHAGEVYSVAFSADGLMVASGSTDQTIMLWKKK